MLKPLKRNSRLQNCSDQLKKYRRHINTTILYMGVCVNIQLKLQYCSLIDKNIHNIANTEINVSMNRQFIHI